MANYEIEISRSAEKQLRRLARREQERIVQAILPLAQDPLPRGSRKISGYDDVFKLARSLCLAACKAAEVEPLGSVYPDFRDLEIGRAHV